MHISVEFSQVYVGTYYWEEITVLWYSASCFFVSNELRADRKINPVKADVLSDLGF